MVYKDFKKDWTMIRVNKKILAEFRTRKIHPNQSDNELIQILLKLTEEPLAKIGRKK